MPDVMASVFIDVHPSKAQLTLFRTGNCFLVTYTVSANSRQHMLLRVIADSRTRSSGNAVYNCQSSRFDIALRAVCAETNANMT
jgi:hypothetical protein